MKSVDHVRAIQASGNCQRSKGAQFYITPLFLRDLLLENVTHDRGSIVRSRERRAVIRKRQGNQPSAG